MRAVRHMGVIAICLAAACTDPSPDYTIAGTWQGSASQGTIQFTVTQSGESVTGAGSYQLTGGVAQPFTLSNGYVRDSALYVTAKSSATGCEGTLTGSYRRAESDAGAFTATFTCGVTLTTVVTRK